MAYNNYIPNYFYPNYPNYQPQTMPQMQQPLQSAQVQQPMPQQQTQAPMQAPQIQNGGFISVRSEAEARNWPVAPGNSVTFFDENAHFCYTKTCVSQLESPRFDKYKLVKEEETLINAPKNPETVSERKDITYATKEQIEVLESEIQALRTELANMQKEKAEVKKAARTKKEGDGA